MAEDYGDRRARTVDRKREVRAQARDRPVRDLLCSGKVDDGDAAGIRDVDKYPPGHCIELKRFWVRSELHVADLRFFLGIDDCQPATAVTDNDIAGARIDANIVGVTAQHQAAGRREILTAVKAYRTIAGAGDGHEIRSRRIANALRLVEPGHLLDPMPLCEIDDLESTVAERGHQQSFSGYIDSHVIDPPGHPWKRDLAFERQGFFRSCGSRIG